MKVVFISNEIMKADVFIPEIDFPSEPLEGDYIDIETFLKENDLEKFKKYIEENKKIGQGVVRNRNWRNHDGEIMLFLFLDFEDDDENEDDNSLSVSQ